MQLHDVRAQLLRHASRVVLREQAALAALGLDVTSAWIGPDHERHAEPLAFLPHASELADLDVLAR